ncbi:MAG: GNAT family N-acetyltransferase [Desulfuromusa sp.]|nr:GNAT family N-acetyltransferase [Desulfuromusa sp.]
MRLESGSIRKMEDGDLEPVVQTHLESFPDFFLSFLGPRFLRLYYAGVISAPEGIAFVCLDSDGQPSGFVAGTTNPRGFYRRLLIRGWLKFSFASLGAILRRPSAIARVARAVFHPASNPIGADVAGLFSIGVQPKMQGTGAGKALVLKFLDVTKACGCKRVFLTTDQKNNDGVNAFYEKLGFSLERQYETPEGRCMNEYWFTL